MKQVKQKLVVLLVTMMTIVSSGVSAHDIDIYISNTSSTSAAAPLVMFTIDTRPNTNTSACTSGTSDPCYFLRVTETIGGVTYGPYLPATGTITLFDQMRAVLKYVLDRTSGVKVGLMAPHDNGNNCVGLAANKCSNGGYVLAGFQPSDSRAGFDAKLNALQAGSGNTGQSYQGREIFFELFRYLTGQGIYNGHNGWKDLGSTNATNMDSASDAAYPVRWDPTIESGNNYVSPLAGNCAKVYTINLLFQVSNQDADSDAAIAASKGSGGIGVNTATTSPYSSYTEGLAQIVRWLYNTDLGDGTWGTVPNLTGIQNVTSFFVTENDNVKTRQYASAGTGANSGVSPYVLSTNPQALATTLTNIFKQILSVSTSFTSPSVAVNTYNRASVLNDVYIAMFNADAQGRPLWPGNIKKLQVSGSNFIDATGANAVSPTDDRINYSALTFWTDATTLPAPDPNLNEIAGKDGRSVARGGCGQRIPSYVSGTIGATNPSGDTTLTSARKVFTEPSTYTAGTPTTPMALEANTTTANALYSPTNYFGSATTTAGSCNPTTDTDGNSACNLIKFARGYTEVYDTTSLTTTVSKLNWLFADPLHSKPLAVNYGTANSHTTTNPDVRILVGSNDGFMRMIRNTTGSGTQEGIESWAFMPREAMSILSTLKQNTATSPVSHPVSVDGSPSVYVYDANLDGNIDPSTDKVYAFFGMRRGGYSYYALDITTPDSPKFLWKITKGGDFAELGQTWSTPKVGKMITDGTNAIPVLIFGGGYDPNKDTHPPHVGSRTVGSNDTQGNAIFIVNLQTGALIWKAIKGTTTGYNSSTKAYTHPDLVDSIPSDVTAVDTDNNGLIDRIYVGDTGGVLWRVDLKCSVPSGVHLDGSNNPTPGCGTASSPKPWSLVPLLSVGRHVTSNVANDRRFFYAPDYVQTMDGSGNLYDGIPIGTGDREDPKNTDTINYFYMFKDMDIQTGDRTNYNAQGLITHTQMMTSDITNCTPATPCSPFPPLTYGWALKLECPATNYATPCGEKNLAASKTISGTIYFSTFTPGGSSTNACQLSEGTGAAYGVAIQDGAPTGINGSTTLDKAARLTVLLAGGIPPEIVTINNISTVGLQKIDAVSSGGARTYWYKKNVK